VREVETTVIAKIDINKESLTVAGGWGHTANIEGEVVFATAYYRILPPATRSHPRTMATAIDEAIRLVDALLVEIKSGGSSDKKARNDAGVPIYYLSALN
jgi:hypothetical protein